MSGTVDINIKHTVKKGHKGPRADLRTQLLITSMEEVRIHLGKLREKLFLYYVIFSVLSLQIEMPVD